MTALAAYFFRYPERCDSSRDIIRWWEKRRLTYNLAVGGAGVVTLVMAQMLTLLPPSPVRAAFLLSPGNAVPIIAYAVAANLCYTSGWMAELALRRIAGEGLAPVGPGLFRYGFAFSVGLTLLPILFAALGWVVRLAMWVA